MGWVRGDKVFVGLLWRGDPDPSSSSFKGCNEGTPGDTEVTVAVGGRGACKVGESRLVLAGASGTVKVSLLVPSAPSAVSVMCFLS